MSDKISIQLNNAKLNVALLEVENCIRHIDRVIRLTDEVVENKLDHFKITALNVFYGSYTTPYFYDRKGALEEAVKISVHYGDWKMETSAEFLPDVYHQDKEIVFNNVFVRGYHGGSEGTDRHGVKADYPSWRTYPYYDTWSTFHTTRATTRAKRSPEAYLESVVQKYIDSMSNKLISDLENVTDQLEDRINKLLS